MILRLSQSTDWDIRRCCDEGKVLLWKYCSGKPLSALPVFCVPGRTAYGKLADAGVKIFEYTPGFIHAKNFLCDGEVGVVGTVNLDYRSFVHHYEDAVLMFKTKALEEIRRDFDEIFEISELQTKESAKRNIIFRWILEIAKVFAPLF